ncbi:MAG: rhodanese-like domain-containing protein [Sumerlaeia bacterium]
MSPVTQYTVEELAERHKAGETPHVLDVRNPDELALAAVANTINIPMPSIAERLGELDEYKDQELIVMCHHGARSQRVAEYLASQGFTNVKNLTGGIHAWSLKVDPTVPTYN